MGNILQFIFCIKQTGFSLEEEAIKVDKLLHEQLQLFSYPLPLEINDGLLMVEIQN